MNAFDIFLSHNSADKRAVEVIAHKLKDAGLEPRLELGLRLRRRFRGANDLDCRRTPRGDGKRFVVRADEKLTTFVELELAIQPH